MLLAPQAPRLAVEGSHVNTFDFRCEDVRIPLYYNGIGGSFPQSVTQSATYDGIGGLI